jgi:MFS family permease
MFGRGGSVGKLLTAVLCSSTATVMQDTVLGLEVFSITHRPFDLGLLGLFAFAPSFLLVVVTGFTADRFDRRRVAACGLVGEVFATIALGAYVATKPTAVGPIFALVFAYGTARAFVDPAERALPADIVGAERLPHVMARFSATWQVSTIGGPALGGFLFAVDHRLPYVVIVAFIAAAVFVVSSIATTEQPRHRALVITPPDGLASDPAAEPAPSARLGDAVDGLRFVRSQPIVLGAISLDLFAVLFGGAVALLPAIAEDRLHVGAVGVGWLRAAGGIGAATVTLLLATRPIQRRVGRRLLVAVAVFGIATIVLGLTHVYAIAFAAMLVLSGADAISVFIRATLVPLVTPIDMRGRVLAVENVFIGASNELGAFESGVAAQWLGAGGAVVLGGVATLVIAMSWGACFRALRNVDRFPRVALES